MNTSSESALEEWNGDSGAATEGGVIVSLLAATRRHLQCWEWISSSKEEMCRATGMGIHAWSLYGET